MRGEVCSGAQSTVHSARSTGSGAVVTIITSFDIWAANLPLLEIYGSSGTLTAPDPNTFGGPVALRRGRGAAEEIEIARPYAENSRGLGVADLAYAIRTGRPARAGGELAYHVLDIMHAIHDASRDGRHVELESTCNRPEALPASGLEG